jgi:hypothetical protein
MKKLRFSRISQVVPSLMQERLRKRFRSVPIDELIRWVDNTHTAFGQNVQELRKSLARDDPHQAGIYMEDIRKGATTLLAAMDALEERLSIDKTE